MSSPVEAFFSALAKYSWRTLVGIFVAAGAILFFAGKLGIKDWAQPLRGYLVAAFILSGAVLATHLATTLHEFVFAHRRKRVDLQLVAGTSTHSTWSIGAIGKKPVLQLDFVMNFAHTEPDLSVNIKRAYLKGTKDQMMVVPLIVVEGPHDEQTLVHLAVAPIRVFPGKILTGRVVFVDQFNDKHVSDKIPFSPRTVPSEMRTNQLKTSPNCFFCNQPVQLGDEAPEAAMTAHIKCIWP